MSAEPPKRRFQDLFESYTHIRLASPQEGAALSQFARTQFMQTKNFGVAFERGTDFFTLLRAYTTDHWVIAILNDDGSLVGMGSITRFQTRIKGELKHIGYLSDLRIDRTASSETRKQWRAAYEAIVQHVDDENSLEHCDHLISAVFQENEKALGIFKNQFKNVQHTEIAQYWNLSIFHPVVWPRRTEHLNVSTVSHGEIESLTRGALAFASLPIGAEVVPVLVRDQQMKTLMGAVVWDARQARRLRVFNLPWSLKLGFGILSLFTAKKFSTSEPWIIHSIGCVGWGAGVSRAEQLDAFSAVVKFCFHRREADFHLLNLTVMDSEFCNELQRRFPISKTSAGYLFEITTPHRKPKLASVDLEFEGAFL